MITDKAPEEKVEWYFDAYQQWTEILSNKYNWKSFNIVTWTFEYADHIRPTGYAELHIALLGFGLIITRLPPGKTEDMQKLMDLAANVDSDMLEGPTEKQRAIDESFEREA